MTWLSISAILITLAAAFAYVNQRFIKLPVTVAVTAMSLLLVLVLALADTAGLDVRDPALRFLRQFDFSNLLLDGMLGLLLFAGALHVDINDLLAHRWSVATFATVGVVGSTLLVGTALLGLSKLLALPIRPIHCFLFGALISPTDPIGVLAVLKRIGAAKSLEVKLAGESLFNDGIGVVVFVMILSIATGRDEATAANVVRMFLQEAVGAAALGLVCGWAAYRLMKSIDNYRVEILITLALATGSYALAGAMHLSAPIAAVVAGLLVGNQGRRLATSPTTVRRLDDFWELIDETLNTVLFVLIGLEALVLSARGQYLLAGAIAIPVVLAARLISIAVPVSLLRLFRPFAPRAVRILTWAGLRGGISVALALSLPYDTPARAAARELLLTMTYCVVLFAILVQGLTIKALIQAGPAPGPVGK